MRNPEARAETQAALTVIAAKSRQIGVTNLTFLRAFYYKWRLERRVRALNVQRMLRGLGHGREWTLSAKVSRQAKREACKLADKKWRQRQQFWGTGIVWPLLQQ